MAYRIKTKRTLLRLMEKSDGPSIIPMIRDPLVYRNTFRIPKQYTPKDFSEWITQVVKEHKQKPPRALHFAIVIGGRAVGAIGLSHILPGHQAVVGYWLGKEYRGKGIMTEAVKAVIAFATKTFKVRRLTAEVFKHNPASKRVLEKAGFKVEALMIKARKKDGKFIDAYLLARVR